ncbi:hypothetical protein EON63_22470 [archaeon]|nr:MAG: hypothetical protein EON63_22470 [archaeon]
MVFGMIYISNHLLCFPSSRRKLSATSFTLTPEQYVPLFKSLGVTCVVRFNDKLYDKRVFTGEFLWYSCSLLDMPIHSCSYLHLHVIIPIHIRIQTLTHLDNHSDPFPHVPHRRGHKARGSFLRRRW